MTATEITGVPLDAREIIITRAHQVYRRSQDIPVPPACAGHLARAQSRLWHHIEPYTRTVGRASLCEADVDAIGDGLDDLVSSVEWHCGEEVAAGVAGDDLLAVFAELEGGTA